VGCPPHTDTSPRTPPDRDEAVRRACADGCAAAMGGEEAAPGCTTTPEARALPARFVAGANARRDRG
jgi:hypothetical protein